MLEGLRSGGRSHGRAAGVLLTGQARAAGHAHGRGDPAGGDRQRGHAVPDLRRGRAGVGVLSTIAAAVGLFVATNLDDIVILTVLFAIAARGTSHLRGWQIVAGQYLGLITLIAVSFVAALGLTIVPDEWVGLLGLIPLAIGVLALVRTLRGKDD